MLVKEVISEEMVTLAEVNEILNDVKDRQNADVEMVYEKRKAIAHANKYVKTKAADARKLVKELLKLDKMKPEIAIKIADIMPKSKDELKTIYAKERFTLTKEDLDNILDIVSKYI